MVVTLFSGYLFHSYSLSFASGTAKSEIFITWSFTEEVCAERSLLQPLAHLRLEISFSTVLHGALAIVPLACWGSFGKGRRAQPVAADAAEGTVMRPSQRPLPPQRTGLYPGSLNQCSLHT